MEKTLMIMQPLVITQAIIIDRAIAEAAKKKALAELAELRLGTFTEGRCAQTLHLGPFPEEGSTIARVRRFIEITSAKAP